MSPSRFDFELRGEEAYPRDVAARPVEAGNQAEFDRVAAMPEYDGNGCGGGLRRQRGLDAAGRGDDRHLPAHQIGGERRQPIVLSVCEARFDCDIAAFHIAGFARGRGGTCLRPEPWLWCH